MRLRKAKGRPRSSCRQVTIERRNRQSCRCLVLQRLSAPRLTQLTASSLFLPTAVHLQYRLRDRLRPLRRTVGVTTMAQLRESVVREERDPHAPPSGDDKHKLQYQQSLRASCGSCFVVENPRARSSARSDGANASPHARYPQTTTGRRLSNSETLSSAQPSDEACRYGRELLEKCDPHIRYR
jgi:hypothetical protein